MINRIILFEGDIETTAYFSRQMEKVFLKAGYQTFFYDYEKEGESARRLMPFIRKGETAAVGFNFHGICGKNEVFYDEERDVYMWDDLHIPYFNIVVDHPYYYDKFLCRLPKRYIHISIDGNHERYMRHYYPQIALGPFLPLAGTPLTPLAQCKPIRERSMDVVFTGNYVPPDDFMVYIERHGDEYTEFYMGILHELMAHPDRTLEDVATEHILREIPEATDADLKETLGNMIFLDMYIRFYFRGEAVRILAEAGIKVHVFGDGYDRLECAKKENIISGGSLNSLGCLEKIADAKISLNVMPWFKQGAHDRIFNSMLNGAVALTDSSEYLASVLKDGENAAVYSLEQMEQLPGIVERLLADEDNMQRIADAGYRMAEAEHTWAKRAEEIIKLLQEYHD